MPVPFCIYASFNRKIVNKRHIFMPGYAFNLLWLRVFPFTLYIDECTDILIFRQTIQRNKIDTLHWEEGRYVIWNSVSEL